MSFQQLLEEGATGRKDHFVGLDALILTGQGDISKVIVNSEFSEGNLHYVLEIIPLQAKLFGGHDGRPPLFVHWL